MAARNTKSDNQRIPENNDANTMVQRIIVLPRRRKNTCAFDGDWPTIVVSGIKRSLAKFGRHCRAKTRCLMIIPPVPWRSQGREQTRDNYGLASLMLPLSEATGRGVMDVIDQSNERPHMTNLQSPPVIPAHPNIVEMVALLEDPQLRTKERTQLKRVLHDTVHLVRKQDGVVQQVGFRSS